MYINLTELNHIIKKRQSNNKCVGLPFGSAIKYKRDELKMTLEEASADICSVSYLSKLENNIIKPSAKYVDLLKKRFNIKEDYVYDSDEFKTHIEMIIRAILLDQKIEHSLLKDFETREDYESVLINFAYHVLHEDSAQIEYYYKKIVSSILSMPEEAFMTAMLLVDRILYDAMRYSEGVDLLNTIEAFNPEHEKIKLLILKGKTRHAFKLNNLPMIHDTYETYKHALIQKHLFSQFKKIHLEKLIHEAKHRSCDCIIQEIDQIDGFEECDRQYLKAKCFSYKGDYDKVLSIATMYKDQSIDWMILYVMALEHLNETKKIIQFIETHQDINNARLNVICKHLKYKYKSTQEEQMSYIKRDILTFHGMTEDYEILNYLLKDCEQMLVKHQYYKDAVSLYRIFVKKLNDLAFA